MGSRRGSRKKVFDRAYTKAVNLQPGQESTLTQEEEEVLLRAIESYRENVWRPRQQRIKELMGL